MKHFVYYPFGIAKMDSDTSKSLSHFIGRYGNEAIRASEVVWTGAKPIAAKPVLGEIGPPGETVLIIDTHGNGTQFVRTEIELVRYVGNLQPEDLAEQLAVDGLPTGFIWIKLNVCLSDNAAASQARALAMAMANKYPQVMVAGVRRSVFTHRKASEDYRCMKCGTKLPQNLGFRTAGEEDDPNRSWAGDDLTYYSTAGAAVKKSVLRPTPSTHIGKHRCPQCGELQPKDVGDYRDSEKLLRSIVSGVPDKPLSAFLLPRQPIPAAAAALPRATAVTNVASARPGNKRCTKCGHLHINTTKTICIKCNSALP